MCRRYRVHFTFKKKGNKLFVFSLPQTNEYQEIKELSIDPKPAKLDFDEWGNTVTTFKEKTNLKFLYSPKSVIKSIDKKWTIGNYKINKELLFFTTSNRFINGKDPKITKLVNALVEKEQNVFRIARVLYDFVLEFLTYGKPIKGLYPYTQALEEKVTDCGGFSTLLLSLFQSVGIPGRLVVGFVVKKKFTLWNLGFDFFSMHAWPEILLPDNFWFPMDPSVEWRKNHHQSKRVAGFGKIPADRLVTSFGQGFSDQIDLLQLPIYL